MKQLATSTLTFCTSILFSCIALAEPVQVFVSVIPQKTFVEKIGGEHVVVHAMVQPGDSPALYEPKPRQMQLLSKASMYLTAGIPFEKAWMQAIISANKSMKIVNGLNDLTLRTLEAHSHDDEHEDEDEHGDEHEDEHGDEHEDEHGDEHEDEHGDSDSENMLDPHTWTSPIMVKRIITTIRDALIELDPKNKQAYLNNHTAYTKKINKLDSDIRESLSSIKNRKFMVFHPAWGYFADTYDLTQIAVEKSGKEPGTKGLKNLIDQAKRNNIKAIFVQPQFSKKSAMVIAKAIDGQVINLDPLDGRYSENLREVTRKLKDALD